MAAARHLGGARDRVGGAAPYAPDPMRDWLRMIGGLVFAVGAFVLFIRKSGGSGGESAWDDFPLLLVLLVPCALLYAVGVLAGRSAGGVQAWQAVLLVTAVLLVPFTLGQLLEVLDSGAESSFHVVWIFGSAAALAAYAALALGASYQALLSAIFLVIAWLGLADWVLDEPGVAAFRVLLLIAAGALIAGAVALRRGHRPEAPELITAAGLAAVAAGVLGGFETVVQLTGGIFGGGVDGEAQSPFWDVVLLLVSAALVAYGARVGARGTAYVGAFGLLAFAVLTGLELSGRELSEILEGDPDQSFVGWPLLLLLGGGAALAAGLGLRGGPSRATGAPAAEPPPGPMAEAAAEPARGRRPADEPVRERVSDESARERSPADPSLWRRSPEGSAPEPRPDAPSPERPPPDEPTREHRPPPSQPPPA